MSNLNLSSTNTKKLLEARQHELMRNALNISPVCSEDIEFSIARSPEEIKAACEILYHAYTDAGFLNADGSGYRFTVYHALPYCYTLIAKQAGEVIGTVSLIVRSTDKLPIENIFPITPYLGFGRRVAEVSALTVHPKARGKHGAIVFPLFKYLYTVASQLLGVTDLMITCNPKHLAFYKAIVLFEMISEEVKESYDFVDGAPAVAARLDVTRMSERYERVYGGQPPHKNVYDYIIVNEFPQFLVPDQEEIIYSGNRWSPDQLAWMLETLAIGRSKLPAADMSKLRAAYGPEYDRVFDRFAPSVPPQRCNERVDLNVEATLIGNNAKTKARVLAATDQELRLSVEADLCEQGIGYKLEIGCKGDLISLPLGAANPLGNDEYGFRIGHSDRDTLLMHSLGVFPASPNLAVSRN